MALNNLGAALRDFPWSPLDAIAFHEEAAAIFRETGDRHAEGSTLNYLGLALVKKQRFDEADSRPPRRCAHLHARPATGTPRATR